MGERLNIEIWNNGKVLANAYYHWSGYTESATILTKQALRYIEEHPLEDDNEKLYSIRILEATGAGLTDRELEYAKTDEHLKGISDFAECFGRNEGLLGISPNEIEQTRYWQEEAVYIFLDEKRVSFGAVWKQKKWSWEKDQREEYDNKDADAKKLEVVDWNLDDIKFADFEKFAEFMKDREKPFVSSVDFWNVISPIG